MVPFLYLQTQKYQVESFRSLLFFLFYLSDATRKVFFSSFNGTWDYIWPMQLIQEDALILRSIPLITAAKFLCYIRKNIPRSAHFHMVTSPGWETKICAFWGERYYSATTFMNTKHNWKNLLDPLFLFISFIDV